MESSLQKVSIPSSSGHVFRPIRNKRPMDRAEFQSPLRRGTSSDTRNGYLKGFDNERFQSPLRRGTSSDLGRMAQTDQASRVSIPSSSGHVFRRAINEGWLQRFTVSIPSSSGHVFRRPILLVMR